MIDYFLRYNNEKSAEDDRKRWQAELGLPVTETWQLQRTIPDVKCWHPSEDTIVDGTVVHQYLGGYYLVYSLATVEQVLINDKALEFALDREACNRGEPFIIANNIGSEASDYAFEPMFAGSTYPLGGYH